jgi:cytochrome c
MEVRNMMVKATGTIFAGILALAAGPALALDEGAAQSLMKKSGCLKCHALSAKKEGPAFKETAAKYKGKADAESKLFTHLTTSPMIEVDGNKERHDGLKTKKDEDVKNVVQYILSR